MDYFVLPGGAKMIATNPHITLGINSEVSECYVHVPITLHYGALRGIKVDAIFMRFHKIS
jgi:hypothetical protein